MVTLIIFRRRFLFILYIENFKNIMKLMRLCVFASCCSTILLGGCTIINMSSNTQNSLKIEGIEGIEGTDKFFLDFFMNKVREDSIGKARTYKGQFLELVYLKEFSYDLVKNSKNRQKISSSFEKCKNLRLLFVYSVLALTVDDVLMTLHKSKEPFKNSVLDEVKVRYPFVRNKFFVQVQKEMTK